MTSGSSVRIETAGAVLVAAVDGDLAFDTVPDVEHALRAAVHPGTSALVLDLTDVRFIDSRAIQMLFALHADAAAHRRRLVLVLPPDAIARRALELVGAGTELAIAATRAAAVAAAVTPRT
jgi:anti-anti-sigma factor